MIDEVYEGFRWNERLIETGKRIGMSTEQGKKRKKCRYPLVGVSCLIVGMIIGGLILAIMIKYYPDFVNSFAQYFPF